jgi:hypothetical protein
MRAGAQVEVCETNTLLTPLCVAAKAGSWEICSMLIDAGAKYAPPTLQFFFSPH